jgi:hypothetical protein
VGAASETGSGDDHDPPVPAPGAGYETSGAPARNTTKSARKIANLDP